MFTTFPKTLHYIDIKLPVLDESDKVEGAANSKK